MLMGIVCLEHCRCHTPKFNGCSLIATSVVIFLYCSALYGQQMVQVSFGAADGIVLPAEFYSHSGSTSPWETRLPEHVDARTELRVTSGDAGQVVWSSVTHYSNGEKSTPMILRTVLEFYGMAGNEEMPLLSRHVQDVRVDGPVQPGEASSVSSPDSGNIAATKLIEVRIYHRLVGIPPG